MPNNLPLPQELKEAHYKARLKRNPRFDVMDREAKEPLWSKVNGKKAAPDKEG